MNTDPVTSYECLDKLLQEDNENPVALTWSAWLLSLNSANLEGVEKATTQGLAAVRLNTAVDVAPNYSYARAFRAIVAYRNGRLDDAETYLQDFKDNDPSADAAQVIQQMNLEQNIADARAAEGTSGTTTTTVPGN